MVGMVLYLFESRLSHKFLPYVLRNDLSGVQLLFVFNSVQVLQTCHLSCFKCHWYNDRKCPILAIIGLGSNRNNTLLLTSQILEFHFTWVVFPLFCFPWPLACFHSTMHHTSCLLVERSLTRGFILCFPLSTKVSLLPL